MRPPVSGILLGFLPNSTVVQTLFATDVVPTLYDITGRLLLVSDLDQFSRHGLTGGDGGLGGKIGRRVKSSSLLKVINVVCCRCPRDPVARMQLGAVR